MAKYTIQEIKEIIIETTVEADDAQEAFMVYKNRHTRRTGTSKISEETHITVDESKEVEELNHGQE